MGGAGSGGRDSARVAHSGGPDYYPRGGEFDYSRDKYTERDKYNDCREVCYEKGMKAARECESKGGGPDQCDTEGAVHEATCRVEKGCSDPMSGKSSGDSYTGHGISRSSDRGGSDKSSSTDSSSGYSSGGSTVASATQIAEAIAKKSYCFGCTKDGKVDLKAPCRQEVTWTAYDWTECAHPTKKSLEECKLLCGELVSHNNMYSSHGILRVCQAIVPIQIVTSENKEIWCYAYSCVTWYYVARGSKGVDIYFRYGYQNLFYCREDNYKQALDVNQIAKRDRNYKDDRGSKKLANELLRVLDVVNPKEAGGLRRSESVLGQKIYV